MLEELRARGGGLLRAKVISIDAGKPFSLELGTGSETQTIVADKVVNAAGPFVSDVRARMLEVDLPVANVFQQKISFEDNLAVVPRDLPFTIDLDPQTLAWSEEDREILLGDPEARKLAETMIGGIHCRPDGPYDGAWIKLGWAYNKPPTEPHLEDPIDPQFPDIVLRGASRLQPWSRQIS